MGPIARDGHQQGFTLMEVVVALGVASVVLLILGNILLSSTSSIDSVITGSTADQEMKKGLGRLLGELQGSSPTVVSISTADPDHDAITFQTPGSYNGGVNWGATESNGTWQAGWSTRYLVASGNLVRRVLDGSGNQIGPDELLVRRLDASTGGVKGFRMTRNGALVTATVRTRKGLRDSHEIQKEFTSSMFLKNP